jgi:hypothetical protein
MKSGCVAPQVETVLAGPELGAIAGGQIAGLRAPLHVHVGDIGGAVGRHGLLGNGVLPTQLVHGGLGVGNSLPLTDATGVDEAFDIASARLDGHARVCLALSSRETRAER